ncbi:MAG: hypothetical protein KDA89_04565 [Planctomycetaceae bacterium]|nr:hypothetical protein [Planctomycetaceae bacterium]
MYVIERKGSCDEAERRVSLKAGRRVSLGGGNGADVCLLQTFGVPGVCLEIWVEDDVCIARNKTGHSGLVFLNGKVFYDLVRLENGDDLQVGNDQFVIVQQRPKAADKPEPRVAVPSSPVVVAPVVVAPAVAASRVAAPAVAPEPPVVRQEPAVQRNIRAHEVQRGVVRHVPEDGRWSAKLLLEELAGRGTLLQFTNFRHAGVTPPSLASLGDDLFETMPEEVRSIYSLHVLSDASVDERLQVHRLLEKRDAEVWGIPSDSVSAAMKDSKLYLAWLARPSVLEMTLERSPRDFCESLLAPFRAVILVPKDGKSPWAAYSGSDVPISQLPAT